MTEPHHRAGQLAAAADHCGDWRHSISFSSHGIRLTHEAVDLRLGTELCQHSHLCTCGAEVDSHGWRALSCRQDAETDLNVAIFSMASYGALKNRADEKHLDGYHGFMARRSKRHSRFSYRYCRSILRHADFAIKRFGCEGRCTA